MSAIFYLFILPFMLHPVIVSVLLLAASIWALARWHAAMRLRLLVVGAVAAALVAYYVVDAVRSAPRVTYAEQIPRASVVHQTIPTPKSLVLVNNSCDSKCLARLVDGTHDEVIVIRTATRPGAQGAAASERPATRYRIERRAPGACQPDPQRRDERAWTTATVKSLWDKGICPAIDEVPTPTTGVFIIFEFLNRVAREPATDFTPEYLTARPPGPIIQFFGLEVQRRSADGVAVLAQSQWYFAPGYLGLPPLIGCWQRPDNIFWVLPAGDTGCGLWRRLIDGGDRQTTNSIDWVYWDVFKGA